MTTSFTPAGNDCLLTELDHQRLRRFVSRHEPLHQLLDGAELVPSTALPANVVSMNSEVEVLDPALGRPQRLTLCYPADANADQGRISVLSPVGLSLLGRPVGSRVQWRVGGGIVGSLCIEALLYQPEASGHLTR